MDKFLNEIRATLCKLDDNKVHVVLGNEACDLDSVVSALVYAFFCHSTKRFPNSTVIPLLNVRRELLSLRKEVVYFLCDNNISLDSLIFKEELDLQLLTNNEQLSVTLVDHNQLAQDDGYLKNFVIEIIDHHQLQPEWESCERCLVTADMTGSCATLIAEKLLSDISKFVNPQIASLLYGTIIFDTINLNDDAKRVTPRDKAVAKKLSSYLGDVDSKVLFDKLRDAKHNVSGFTMEELLHSDLKIICNDTIKIAIASIASLLQDVLKKSGAENDLEKFSSSTKSQIVILMGVAIDAATQVVSRELAIYSQAQGYREQMVDLFEAASSRGPKLSLQSLTSPFASLVLYRQANSAASRKVIIPLLNTFLFGGASPSLSLSGDSQERETSRREMSFTARSDNARKEASSGGDVDYELDGFDPLRAESEDTLMMDSVTSGTAHLHVLGAGDPISHAGSSQSSSNQNSCPYTPQNSCMDGGLEQDFYARQILPSFNSREMMEKIESKRGKLRGGSDGEPDGRDGAAGSRDIPSVSPFHYSASSYPFTPKNSFVDSSFDGYYVRGGAGGGGGEGGGGEGANLDSSDLLFRVNERVTASLGTTLEKEGGGGGGGGEPLSILVEVPTTLGQSDAEPRLFVNGHHTSSAVCNSRSELGDDVTNGGLQEGGTASAAERDGVQSCPEAVSLSEKNDKSDEKMDTSETSGSSEKTSPIPNDVDVHSSTETTTASIRTTNMTGADTPLGNATNAITNANLVKKTSDTDPSHQNTRTESIASISSLQGDDADLELAANYQTETVDFPDNPLQLKLMNQTVLLQGTSVDESVADDDTEQQDDEEVFRAVLSPSSDGVKLRKADESAEGYRSDSNVTGESALHQSTEDSNSGYARNPWLTSATNDLGSDSTNFSGQTPTFNLTPDNHRTDQTAANKVRAPGKTSSSDAMISTPYPSADVNQGQRPHFDLSLPEDLCAGNTKFTIDHHPNADSIVRKMRSCIDTGRVKDVVTLCSRLQGRLDAAEIDSILRNSSYYSEFFDQEEQQYVLEAVRALRYDLSVDADKSGQAQSLPAIDTSKLAAARTKIQVNSFALDDSITERFQRELEISAVFEGNRSLRLSAKTGRRPLTQSFPSLVGLFNDTRPSLMGISHGHTEAFFQESATTDKPNLRKIAVPIGLNEMLDVTGSSDVDTELDSKDFEEMLTDIAALEISASSDREKASNQDRNISSRSPDLPLAVLVEAASRLDRVCAAPLPEHSGEINSDSTGERPNTLSTSGKKKRKIKVNPDILNTTDDQDDKRSLSSLSNDGDDGAITPGGDMATLGDMAALDDMATPDDIDTPEELDDSLMTPDPIPEVSAEEERDDERRWRTCVIGGVQRKIDLKVIEPYKKVLSHGGYYGLKRSAIIVFSACYLPDHSRKDYDYVMDNLFLYVLTTLDQLVAEDYVLVYLHGAMDRNNMPTFGWLKRCYQMIDRRLRKNLKGLYLVHPTFWLKTIVLMTRPFISTKFSRKLQFVNTLQELSDLVPIDQMSIPDRVKQLEFKLMIQHKKKHAKVQTPPVLKTESTETTPPLRGNREQRHVDHEAAYRVANSEYPAFTKGWV